LIKGTFDIPFHTEPDNDVGLHRYDIDLSNLESEYSKFQPSTLADIASKYRPKKILAYGYSPRGEDLRGAKIDQAEMAANPNQQVLLNGFGFYMSAQVIVLEFDSESEAAGFADDFFTYKFGIYAGGSARYRHGAIFTEPFLAYRLAGRYFYIIGSWMPETIDAILVGGQ
jgi:hypothetical protein